MGENKPRKKASTLMGKADEEEEKTTFSKKRKKLSPGL